MPAITRLLQGMAAASGQRWAVSHASTHAARCLPRPGLATPVPTRRGDAVRLLLPGLRAGSSIQCASITNGSSSDRNGPELSSSVASFRTRRPDVRGRAAAAEGGAASSGKGTVERGREGSPLPNHMRHPCACLAWWAHTIDQPPRDGSPQSSPLSRSSRSRPS
jgi:hypothetical protein